MTQSFTVANKTYPVNDDHELSVPGADESAVLAKWKTNAELDPEERRVLAAINNRENLTRAAAWLDGKELAEFGFETLDQVHGQTWHPDVCEGLSSGTGCEVHQVWDHRLRHTGEGIVVHAHRSHRTCERHATLSFKDHHEHQAHLQAECAHKEAVLSAITDHVGLHPTDRPAWRFNENHELEIDTTSHPVITPQHVNRVIRDNFPQHVIHVK